MKKVEKKSAKDIKKQRRSPRVSKPCTNNNNKSKLIKKQPKTKNTKQLQPKPPKR